MFGIQSPQDPQAINGEYKIKLSLLGPEESFKTAFREKIANGSLSNHNKAIIGVTIAGLKIVKTVIEPEAAVNIYISLWDIDCSCRFSIFRTAYYRGSEAIIVLLDENTLDQAEPYYSEILRHNPTISITFVVLYEEEDCSFLEIAFRSHIFNQFERIQAKEPQDVVEWVQQKFCAKLKDNHRQDCFAIMFLPKKAIINNCIAPPQYLEYVAPAVNFDEFNPHQRLNFAGLVSLISKLGLPVQDDYTPVENKFGTFKISLRDGSIRFTPRRCIRCKQKCRQEEFVCIIASSKGYSSNPEITQAELLVTAKVLSLQDGDLPDHVLKQIARLDKCPAHALR